MSSAFGLTIVHILLINISVFSIRHIYIPVPLQPTPILWRRKHWCQSWRFSLTSATIWILWTCWGPAQSEVRGGGLRHGFHACFINDGFELICCPCAPARGCCTHWFVWFSDDKQHISIFTLFFSLLWWDRNEVILFMDLNVPINVGRKLLMACSDNAGVCLFYCHTA